MLLFLAGTSDSRELALRVQSAGYPLLASVVTESAAESLQAVGIPVRSGRLNEQQMAELICERQCTGIVDASHPFAEEASLTAMEVAKKTEGFYIRYERPAGEYGTHPSLRVVQSYEEAAVEAKKSPGVILLTTGSKTLEIFTNQLLNQPGIRMIARMLPREDNLTKCEALGIPQRDIVAMQGPFKEELNRALYEHFAVTTVITKESGKVGSVDEKVGPALDMGLNVILIARPRLDYGCVYTQMDDVMEHLNKGKGVGDVHSGI
ncbi:precorrin-6A reductase [Marininema halotolerans]|uniref:Precorrin-6A/cobalt-precorrin-6A reductase n=1 Tax=Marininema halotolerans TaxID=1155944 RepID=A0A1I6QLP2_9BACL|nr:precorrin-6A reductase [Marininema halotolerans]SFS53333.1 precorrin-6A/cobalt-precorrin-6A reductase [Marininema halotolerans]